jgi:threonine dehydrogenase-like Zn-dependent dehydrogenase
MKAVQFTALNRLDLVETGVPLIQPDELLIRTGASTICTSDVMDLRHNPFDISLPVILGHEAAGVVAAVGSAVQGFQVGDHVASHPVHPCGICPTCREGAGHLCDHLGHFGINMPGTHAEYYRVGQDRARLIPRDLPFSTAALAEPVCVCLEALAQARLSERAHLLILGDGPFGILMTRLAAKMLLERIVIAGMFDFRLSFALASTRVNLSGQSHPVEALLAANDGRLYEAVILAVSSQEAFLQGLACLKPKGRLVVFSALHGNTPVDLFRVHVKELEIVGACSDQDRLDDAVALLNDGSLRLDELVTHHFSLEEYKQAFSLAEFGKSSALKIAFDFPVEAR